MELVLLLAMGAAIVYLWRRVDTLERRIAELEPGAEFAPLAAERIAEPEPLADEHKIAPPEPATAPSPIPASLIEPEPVHPHEPEPARRRTPAFDFEEIFGRLLPIWAGGVALAVAGFFLVRYSIEAGLMTEGVRVALGFGFGAALIAAAEVAYRQQHRLGDERVRQALAGAGLATLYASFYLAGSLYGLIGGGVAFLGLAAVTATAIALSFRFGLPSAILGLVGGFAAPLLVESDDPNLALLALYLALVTAGLAYTGRRQDRAWLALAALGGGLGWGALLLLSGASGFGETLSVGLYLVTLGAIVPAFVAGGRTSMWLRIGAAGVASLQMAALVHQGGYSALAWTLYALLGAALAALGWRIERLREASLVAAAVALWLLGFWPAPAPLAFALVGAALTAIFAGVALAHRWRGAERPADVVQLCAFPLGLTVASWWQFGAPGEDTVAPLLALATLALAALPALGAWRGWPDRNAPATRETIVCLASALGGVWLAFLFATPGWAAPLAGAALAALVHLLMRGHSDAGLVRVSWGLALAGLVLLLCLPWTFARTSDELWQLGRTVADETDLLGTLRWLAAAAAFLPPILREPSPPLRATGETIAALLLYGAAAQVLPGEALAWFAALAAGAIVWRWPTRRAGPTALLAPAGLWVLVALAPWLGAGLLALGGDPFFAGELAGPGDALLYLLPLLAGTAAFVRFASAGPSRRTVPLGPILLGLALVVLHHLYKPLFAIDDMARFAALGLGERTVWEAALLAGALAAWRVRRNGIAAILASVALAHFALFTLALHNPLWAEQTVGGMPLVNWLLPAYAVALGACLLLSRLAAVRFPQVRPAFDGAAMVLIAFLALSELRHAFAGSLLTSRPIGQAEELLRSLAGIVLAIGFLWWGSRKRLRSWRVGSLVLMLGAVLKVFLFDADGLEGLARIASFMALGFSLIGIGWFYTRQLKARPALEETAASA